MAIVFISPKQRQKMFFAGITIMFVLLVLVISMVILLSRPAEVPEELVFNRPKIDIDLKVLDLDQVKNLELPAQMDIQFKYSATTEKGVKTSGIVTATSLEEAKKMLVDMKLTNIVLEESIVGRENPFSPYYNISPAVEEND